MKRIGSVLMALALIAGLAGCTAVGSYGESQFLTITSTAGGAVISPGEGTFICSDGQVLHLVAEPEEGCQFVNWTGNVGTIANVNDASTTITANARYSIRANFSGNSTGPVGISYNETEVEELIIVLVNAEREKSGLIPLTKNGLLTSLAREHSTYMADNDLLTHERFPGETPFDYGQPPGTSRGENIAKIPTKQCSSGPYLSLEEVCEWAIEGWMGSPGHQENILRSVFTETGVGVSFSEEGAFVYLYITQMFEGAY